MDIEDQRVFHQDRPCDYNMNFCGDLVSVLTSVDVIAGGLDVELIAHAVPECFFPGNKVVLEQEEKIRQI